MAASEHTCTRLPTPQAAWVHQIHAAGGAIGVLSGWLLRILYEISDEKRVGK